MERGTTTRIGTASAAISKRVGDQPKRRKAVRTASAAIGKRVEDQPRRKTLGGRVVAYDRWRWGIFLSKPCEVVVRGKNSRSGGGICL